MGRVMETPVELFDYIIHEGFIDGLICYGLLWGGSDWQYKSNPVVEVRRRSNGFIDCLIKSDEGLAVLKAVKSELAEKIGKSGLLVLYKGAAGNVCQINVPPKI